MKITQEAMTEALLLTLPEELPRINLSLKEDLEKLSHLSSFDSYVIVYAQRSCAILFIKDQNRGQTIRGNVNMRIDLGYCSVELGGMTSKFSLEGPGAFEAIKEYVRLGMSI